MACVDMQTHEKQAATIRRWADWGEYVRRMHILCQQIFLRRVFNTHRFKKKKNEEVNYCCIVTASTSTSTSSGQNKTLYQLDLVATKPAWTVFFYSIRSLIFFYSQMAYGITSNNYPCQWLDMYVQKVRGVFSSLWLLNFVSEPDQIRPPNIVITQQ